MIKQNYKAKESIYFALHEFLSSRSVMLMTDIFLMTYLRISKYVHDMKTAV